MTVAAVPQPIDRGTAQRRGRGLLRSPLIGLCFAVIAIVIVLAVIGTKLAPQNPNQQHLSAIGAGPSSAHWFGTDALGRDVLSRVIAGARTAFFAPLVIAVVSFLGGNCLGLLAGFRGGRIDATIMRWVDVMWSVPTLLVLIVLAGTTGSNYWLSVGVLALLTIPFDTRVVRGAVLEQAPRPYVEAAQTLGVSRRRIMFRHIWPNVAPIAVANTFLVYASSLVLLASLSFLGLGVPPGKADWGLMLSDNESLIFTSPVATIAPGVMIVLTAAAMNLVGDWIQERLADRGGAR